MIKYKQKFGKEKLKVKYTYNKLVRDKIPKILIVWKEVGQDKVDEREEQEMKREWRKNSLDER